MELRFIRRFALVVFVVLAYAFTWLRWVPEALNSRQLADIPIPFVLVLLAGYGPALAAVIVTAITQGGAGLKEFGARLIRWRVGFRWYLIIFLLPILSALVTILVFVITGQAAAELFAKIPDMPILLMYFGMFLVGFDGLGEELGWRGYALPKLQARYSPLASTLLVSLIWTFWHLPFYLTIGSLMANAPFILHMFYILALSVIHTWINHHTNHSTLMAVMFHAANNAFSMFLFGWDPVFVGPQGLLIGTIVYWAIAIPLLLFAQPFRLAGNAGWLSAQTNKNQVS